MIRPPDPPEFNVGDFCFPVAPLALKVHFPTLNSGGSVGGALFPSSPGCYDIYSLYS